MKVCDICGKGRTFGNNVSHSKRRTARSWLPNLHTVKLAVGNTTKSQKVCSQCLRTLAKQRVAA